ncbi:hypothetical protein JOF55_003857 [Haloactinomyces albus]|uniref:Transposase n=1 Tax=Haloactinomyces albus TaxID=1352928 RepID=A0AAE3ZGW5_9ACTN|nr:hypothetical protein [Haloactinomyces albus]
MLGWWPVVPAETWRKIAVAPEGVFQKWVRVCDDHGVARGDLSDAQWAKLDPLLPVGVKSGRPPKRSKRQLIDGIRWRGRPRTRPARVIAGKAYSARANRTYLR